MIGDPTEGAVLVAAGKAGIDAKWVRQRFPRVATVPFSSERKYMATLHEDAEAGRVVCAKGAVERIVDLCAWQMSRDGSQAQLDRTRRAYGRRGPRVAGPARAGHGDGAGRLGRALRRRDLGRDAHADGLHAMADPPRAAAITAVRSCHSAGIDVKMITGDHASTAAAIATELGILTADDAGLVLTGAVLAQLDPSEYPETVERAEVFARVSPEQKLRLVEALQGRDHVVAMTGDGVNDAPALQQADIGIAMGRGVPRSPRKPPT